MKDDIFKKQASKNKDFHFNSEVAGVFDDMISRSVPCYAEVHRMIVKIAEGHAQLGGTIIDIGCSTGTLSYLLADALSDKKVKVIGIDNSPSMIKAAKAKKTDRYSNIDFVCADVTEDIPFDSCSVAIFSLVCQFIRPMDRLRLLQNVCDKMESGGVIILFEKNIFDDAECNRDFINYYLSFKREQDYSEEEIINKRTALENVLIPYSAAENAKLLVDAGFEKVQPFFQWFNFSAIQAKKKDV